MSTAPCFGMPSIRPGLVVLLVSGACYHEGAAPPVTPAAQDPSFVQGPPGGEMDPGYGYAFEGAAYPPGYDGTQSGYPPPEPSSDPQDPGYVMGTVTDAEIDVTLQPYGEWVVIEEYGRVWRPNAMVVGVDFTPYETCGTWVWTDYGWTFSCPEWEWAWLAFHFGRWMFADEGWCWVPGYEWSPAWVEWRHGGDYVGWRPLGPRVRDHRDGRGDGPRVRDHRGNAAAHWRFLKTADLARPHFRSHLFKNLAEGLQLTSAVAQPPLKGATVVRAAHVMGARIHTRARLGLTRTNGMVPNRGGAPAIRSMQPQRPGMTPPVRGWQQPYRPPSRHAPAQSFTPGRGWNQSSPPTRYTPPSQSYPPARYSPPSNPSRYTPPSRSSPPARYTPPSPPPSRGSNWGAPSRPSSSFSSGGGSRSSPPSWSGGSRSSSSSSSSSGGSRSSGSSRASSSSSSGSSRGSSSSSSSSGSSRSSSGGRRR